MHQIVVSQQLLDFSTTELNEDLLLHLHTMVMNGLLVDEEVRLAGKYCKGWIGVRGSKIT